MTAYKRKKKSPFFIGLVVFLVLIFTCLVLIFTGAMSGIKKSINSKFYPLKYKEAILSACNEYDLDPAFVCAVIHTESKFDANASSPAGAMGLMQLMPETFEYLAGKKGVDVPKDITDPQTNIDYGVFYLRYMIDTYGFTDVYTAAAAYNAGPGEVGEWLQNEEYSADGKTLHTIPFEETDKYIERIKDTQKMYQSLYFEE